MVKLVWNNKPQNELNNLKSQESKSFIEVEIFKSPDNEKNKNNDKIINKSLSEQIVNLNHDDKWFNLLIWGDNLSFMKSSLKEFAEKINLIYIDPPFATGGDFNLKIYIGEETTTKKSTYLNQKAYSDSWKEGLDNYLNFMYERLILMRELLSRNGSIYVHLDWHASHYLKIIMDEIFGPENFQNEIIWAYPAASVKSRNFFIRSYDTILFYTKSQEYVFNDDPNIYMEYSNRVKNALKKDEKGIFYYRGGSHDGIKLSRKVYVTSNGIFPRDVWNDIPYIRANTIEYQGFSTQKPELLLKRIILASTKENDIVADFFSGSGTSLAVAEKLKRRWIGCDSTKQAINMTRKRMLDIYNSNDLINRKNKFAKICQPFKILYSNSFNKVKQIHEDFLMQKNQDSHKNNKMKKPKFDIDLQIKVNQVKIELKNYLIPYLNLIAKNVKTQIREWTDWIDYWSIDFDFNQKIFNNQWVSYRTPKSRILKLISNSYYYKDSGIYQIQVKVIDILGIETIQTYKIEIK